MEDPSEIDGSKEEDVVQDEKKFKFEEVVGTDEDIEMGSLVDADDSDEEVHDLEGLTKDINNVIHEDVPEPVFDPDMVLLSWYDSDLNLVIDENTFTAACPLHWKGFCYLQGGIRATHGFRTGRVYYEVKITSLCKIELLEGHLNTHLIRIGWSPMYSSLALGSDYHSFGYDSKGKISTKEEIKDYGKPLNANDVIGVYLDFKEDPAVIFFTVNGEDQGIAYKIPHSELKNEALFPHILTKNVAFECNFGSERTWFAPKKGFTYVDDMPLNDRIPGPRPPENKSDCEVIMLIGLPKCGKSTWAQEMVARNPGKYYIIHMVNFVDKMELMDPSRKKIFLKKIRILGKLLQISTTRCRNYILDQVNATQSEQLWKMKLYNKFQRRAVVIVPPEEEYERRLNTDPPADKEWVMLCKCKMALPEPNYVLNRIEYAELPRKEAKRLLKKYNRQAWIKGFKPYKHFVVRPYVFHKLHKAKKKWMPFPKKRGRFADPADDPMTSADSMPPPNRAGQDWQPGDREWPSEDESPQGPGFEGGPPRSRKDFFLKMKNRGPDWKQREIHVGRQFNLPRGSQPGFRDQDWSPPRKVSRWEPRPRSVSPPRSKRSPPRNPRRGFHQESDADRGPGTWSPHEDSPRDWVPMDNRRNQKVSPARVTRGFMGPGRGDGPGFPCFGEEETFSDCDTSHRGGIVQGSPAQSRPASFSPPRANFQMRRGQDSGFPRERFPKDRSPDVLRPRMGFPPYSNPLRGEEVMGRGFPQRGRIDNEVQPRGRIHGDGFQPGEERNKGNFLPQGKRPGSGFTVENARPLGDFPPQKARNRDFSTFEDSRHKDDLVVVKSGFLRDERFSDFPEQGLMEGFSPQKPQRRSMIQDRDMRSPVPGDRMDNYPHPRSRASGSLSPPYRPPVHFIPDGRPVAEGSMGGKVQSVHSHEEAFWEGGPPHLSKPKARSGHGPMIHLNRPMGNFPYHKDTFAGDMLPQRSDLSGPSSHREEIPGGVQTSTVADPYAENQRLKSENADWKCKFPSKDRMRLHGSMTNHPAKLEAPKNRDYDSKGHFPGFDQRVGEESNMPRGSVERENWKPGGNKDWKFPDDSQGSWKRESNPGTFNEEPYHNKTDDAASQHNYWHPTHGFSSSVENVHKGQPPGTQSKNLAGKFDGEINTPVQANMVGLSSDLNTIDKDLGSHSASRPNDTSNYGSRRSDYSSRSPVQDIRRSSHYSPRRSSDRTSRWSPGRGPIGFLDRRSSPGSGTRESPDHVSRRPSGRKSRWSSVRDRSPGRPSRWSLDFGPKESPDRGAKRSPERGSRGSPERRPRRSPERGSPGQGYRGPPGWGSPERGVKRSPGPGRGPGRSPRRGSGRSPGRGPGRECMGFPDSRPRGGPDRGPRGSPGLEPSGSHDWDPRGPETQFPRELHRVSSPRESRQISPLSGRWHSSTDKGNDREWPKNKIENRNWSQTGEIYGGNPEGLSSNPQPPREDFRKPSAPGGFPPHREAGTDNARNWPSGDFRNRNEFESNQKRFMGFNLGDSIPPGAVPPAGMDVGRSQFLRERLGPKVPDDEPAMPFQCAPEMDVPDSGMWYPSGGENRNMQSLRENNNNNNNNNNNSGFWERVPENRAANQEMEELAPYEQPFDQAVWDSNDPHSNARKEVRESFLQNHPQECHGGNNNQPSDGENRRNIWARVGGYVDDDKGPVQRRLESSASRDRCSPPKDMFDPGRRLSRERDRKPPDRPTGRRSPGRRASPPIRNRVESRRFNPYHEGRKPPLRGGSRGRLRSPPRRKW